MSILSALFAVSLSLTGPSQYTFTSNLFDSSFFTGTGYGDTQYPPHHTLRLEDATFLTEALWERNCAHGISTRGLRSDNFSISNNICEYGDAYYYAHGTTPFQGIRTAIVALGAVTTNSTLNTFVFSGSTNAVVGSFLCSQSATADALTTGYRQVSDARYMVNGISTIDNLLPLVSNAVKYQPTTFPTNLWNYFTNERREAPCNADMLRSCYRLLGVIRSGICRVSPTIHDRVNWNSNFWNIRYVPKDYEIYRYTYTDERGETHVQTDQYPISYTEEEDPDPRSAVWERSEVKPFRSIQVDTKRKYEKKWNSYSFGDTPSYTLIDNGYGRTLYDNQNEYLQNDNSRVTIVLGPTSGMGKASKCGTEFNGSQKIFLVARGIARRITTKRWHTHIELIKTYREESETNDVRFVNVVKTTAQAEKQGDSIVFDFGGSIMKLVSDDVVANTGIFTLPDPEVVVPDGGYDGRRFFNIGQTVPTSEASYYYVASIIYDSIECYIQSSPTYHARVL